MRHFRRVLIIQPYGLGDFLFLTPVLRALRLLPSVEKVDLVLGSRTESVVRMNPHIDEVFVVDKDKLKELSFKDRLLFFMNLEGQLRSRGYDLLLDYSRRPEFAFCAQFLWGIRMRSGFERKKRGFFLNRKVDITEGFTGKNVSHFFCDVAEQAGVKVRDRFLEFFYSREDADLVQTFLPKNHKGLLALAPGGGESWGKDAHFKRWPVRYFAELAETLCRKWNLEVVLLGSPQEKILADEIAGLLKIPFQNLTGRLSIGQTGALIHASKFFLGNDGGLMHIAHALKVPMAAFFGPVDPAVYGPQPADENAVVIVKEDLPCRPCYQKFRYNSQCEKRECLQSLTVAEALRHLAAVLPPNPIQEESASR